MTSTAPIKLAFLGCGYAAKIHASYLCKQKELASLYFASRQIEKAQQYQKKYNGQGSFDSYDAALNDTNIDAVAVTTPPASHLDLTLRALSAGKHVVVEKPPFLHSSDFDAVAQKAAEAGKQVFVAENYFYKPLLIKLRQILREGLIGDPLFVMINALKKQKTANWRDDPDLSGGGALFEGGIHWINFLNNLGLQLTDARGFQPAKSPGLDRSILVTARYREGAVGTLAYSWEVPTLLQGLRISRIFGREGSITFESNGIFLFVRGRKWRFLFPGFRDIAGYKAMFRDFLLAMHEQRPPQFTLEMARRDLEIIEQIYQTIEIRNHGGD